MTTLPAGAPISLPMRSPILRGCTIQPALFQPLISCSPHSCDSMFATRSRAAIGKRPERIAVHVDDAFRDVEERARRGEIGRHSWLRKRKRWILPVCVLGRPSVNFTERGYL